MEISNELGTGLILAGLGVVGWAGSRLIAHGRAIERLNEWRVSVNGSLGEIKAALKEINGKLDALRVQR